MGDDPPEEPGLKYPVLLRLAFALLAVVAAAWFWLILDTALELLINGEGLSTDGTPDNRSRGDNSIILAGLALAAGSLWLLKLAIVGRRK